MALEVAIKKYYPDFSLDVNFYTEKGILGVLGASGCGKSMTLKCIAGIETPDEGKIILNARVLFDSEKKINLSPQKRNIGYLFQNYALFPHMNVEENIAVGIKIKEEQKEIIAKYLKIFHLEKLKKAYPKNLSGGQQQRVALARIFASQPDILMLDEPFSALDDFLKWQVELELAKVLKLYGKNVLFVSHNRDEIYRFCDEIMVLSQGKTVSFSTKKDLFEKPNLIAASKLSGCKNYSRIEKIDKYLCRAIDWNIDLTVTSEISDKDRYIGIRAHELMIVDDKERKKDINVEEFIIDELVENIFSIVIMLRKENAKQAIRLEVSKEYWQNNKRIGDTIYVKLPQDKIFLLNK